MKVYELNSLKSIGCLSPQMLAACALFVFPSFLLSFLFETPKYKMTITSQKEQNMLLDLNYFFLFLKNY
jgi:hypothetical protein